MVHWSIAIGVQKRKAFGVAQESAPPKDLIAYVFIEIAPVCGDQSLYFAHSLKSRDDMAAEPVEHINEEPNAQNSQPKFLAISRSRPRISTNPSTLRPIVSSPWPT